MKALFLSAVIFGFSTLPGCSIGYLAKQGSYQLRLLAGAEPIEKALRSPLLPEKKRQKLILITEVRDFCQRNLHLIANKNYKDVNINFNDAVYNVVASKPLAFTPYTWWFPIVGSVPYKGFFDQRDADNEVVRLKHLGYELW
jgi:predicted aminopeptidase